MDAANRRAASCTTRHSPRPGIFLGQRPAWIGSFVGLVVRQPGHHGHSRHITPADLLPSVVPHPQGPRVLLSAPPSHPVREWRNPIPAAPLPQTRPPPTTEPHVQTMAPTARWMNPTASKTAACCIPSSAPQTRPQRYRPESDFTIHPHRRTDHRRPRSWTRSSRKPATASRPRVVPPFAC